MSDSPAEITYWCRFMRDGIPLLGEYRRTVDGWCARVVEPDGCFEDVPVSDSEGLMPDGISDVEIVPVCGSVEYAPRMSRDDLMPSAVRERMDRVNRLLTDVSAGRIDSDAAGGLLRAMFPGLV